MVFLWLIGLGVAQDCDDQATLSLPQVDGRELPSNAVLRGRYVHTLPKGLAVLDSETRSPVPFDIEDPPPGDGFGGRGWVGIRPTEDAWPAGRTLDVVSLEGDIARFSVAAWSDTVAPEPPELGEAFALESERADGRWREFVIPLISAPLEPVTYEVRFADRAAGFDGAALWASGVDELVFSDGPCGGEAAAHFDPDSFWVEVRAVDHAGNLSRSAVIAPTATTSRSCSTGTGAGFFGALALLVLRRRPVRDWRVSGPSPRG